MDELTRKALVDKVVNTIADYETRELSDTEIEGLGGDELVCILECLQYVEAIALKEKQIETLIQYIFHNLHWCPFKDEANIDFEKECVGFGESGCKDCILRNFEQLNERR